VASAGTSAPPERELPLLTRAQAALPADPAGALALCEEHARTYPAGTFAQEREVIAIDALVRLGRRDEARSRAARFAATYPSSSDRPRIETLVGTLGPTP
jgi:hypothetical protein